MTEDVKITDLTLERFVLHELAADDYHAIAARLANDTHLQARVQALVQSNAATLAAYPPELEAALIIARAAARPAHHALMPQRRKRQISAALTGVVVMATLAWLTPILLMPAPSEGGGDRLKGGPTFLAAERLDTQGHALPLGPDASVHPGDTLQLFLHPSAAAYFTVVALDGDGAVVAVYPADDHAVAVRRSPGEDSLLPQVYTLDTAHGFERLIWVSSPTSFAVQTVLSAAQTLAAQGMLAAQSGRLQLPDGLQQGDLLLHRQP